MGFVKKAIVVTSVATVAGVGFSLASEIRAILKMVVDFGKPSITTFSSNNKSLNGLEDTLKKLDRWVSGKMDDLVGTFMHLKIPVSFLNKSKRKLKIESVNLTFLHKGKVVGTLLKSDIVIDKSKKNDLNFTPKLDIGRVLQLTPKLLKGKDVKINMVGNLVYNISAIGFKKKIPISTTIDLKEQLENALKELL